VYAAVTRALAGVADRIDAGELPPLRAGGFVTAGVKACVACAGPNAARMLALPFVLLCQTEEHAHVLVAEAWQARARAEDHARALGIDPDPPKGSP
jgi:hypothetical protein